MIRALTLAALLAAGPALAITANERGPVGRDSQTYRDGTKPSSPKNETCSCDRASRDTLDGLARQERALNRQRDAGTISAKQYRKSLMSIRSRRDAVLSGGSTSNGTRPDGSSWNQGRTKY